MGTSGDPIHILHVDDEPDFAEMTADFLEHEDDRFTVETATSASEGLDRLSDHEFDCVVSDHDMSGQNGIAFLEAVREEHPDLPFVLFTGKGSEAVASDAISAGVTDYLQKERGTEQYEILANRIRNAVEQARTQRDHQRHLRALETAQEAISILNEDGEFIYVNEAYADLYGYDPGEMIGEHWELIYRDVDARRISEEILPTVEANGFWHGETIGLRADGSTFVEDHRLATTEHGELVCTVQEASEPKERERAIETLHSTARAFMQAETIEGVAGIAVDAIRDLLEMPINAVYRHDETADELAPVAWTDRAETVIGDLPVFTPGEGIAWTVFETGEAQIYGDISTVPERYNPDTEIRSEIILPLDEHGVLIIGSIEPDVFDDTDVSLVQTFAAHLTTALARLKREQTLYRTQEQYRTLAENLPNGAVLMFDTDLRYRSVHGDIFSLVDSDPTDYEKKHISEVFEGETLETKRAMYEATLDGESRQREMRFAGRDYRVYTLPIEDESGAVSAGIVMTQDITEYKQRERALETFQHRAQTLMHTDTDEETAHVAVETAHDVIGVPLSGVHLLADDGQTLQPIAFVDTVRETFDDPPTYDRTADPGSDPASAVVWDAFEEGDPIHITDTTEYGRLGEVTPARTVIVHPLGEYGVFIVSATEPDAFDRTDTALVEILATTLTAALVRVDRETRLRERERRLEIERDRLTALFEMVPDPIAHVQFEDGNPILVDVNWAFEDTFGYDAESVIGQSVNDLIVPPDRRADAEAIDEQALASGGVDREVRRQTADGVGDFLFRSVPIGEPIQTDEYFGIYVEISEQKATERRLERQNERLEEFASIVSHDLRNPLNVADGRLDLAREECDSEHLNAVARAHERMAVLIDDLLTLARQGEEAVDPDPVHLADCADTCWETVETADATLVVETEQTVRADRSQLQQLLENLYRNAVEHGGGDVTITVGAVDDGFYVADDGPGIPPDEREAVFDAGYSTNRGGTGFGLSIVQEIAEAHGWEVSVTDSGTGGARFEITGVEDA